MSSLLRQLQVGSEASTVPELLAEVDSLALAAIAEPDLDLLRRDAHLLRERLPQRWRGRLHLLENLLELPQLQLVHHPPWGALRRYRLFRVDAEKRRARPVGVFVEIAIGEKERHVAEDVVHRGPHGLAALSSDADTSICAVMPTATTTATGRVVLFDASYGHAITTVVAHNPPSAAIAFGDSYKKNIVERPGCWIVRV